MTDLDKFVSLFNEMNLTYEVKDIKGILPGEANKYIKLGLSYLLFDEQDRFLIVSKLPSNRETLGLAGELIRALSAEERLLIFKDYCMRDGEYTGGKPCDEGI
ncbi:hypothetical protein MCHI_003152 [Candidatus Magnetoovum chiemensis]|nr:hypothetical protein MCHI_003152 [Candidatus Magnetoovum chiemensis]